MMTGLTWLRLPTVAAIMALAGLGLSAGVGGTVSAAGMNHTSAATISPAQITALAYPGDGGAVPTMVCGPQECGSVAYLEAGNMVYLSYSGHTQAVHDGGLNWQVIGGKMIAGCVLSYWGWAAGMMFVPVGGWGAAGLLAIACLSGGAAEAMLG